MVEHSKEVLAQNPGRFIWSVSTDVNKPNAIEILRRNLSAGTVGLGETSSGGRGCDSKEMLSLYRLAAEMNAPVLIHFADFPQSEGQIPGTPGIKRMPAVVKANAKTIIYWPRGRLLGQRERRSPPTESLIQAAK
jgi:predicted TIM-barrel fold metal-dependent hydrolase